MSMQFKDFSQPPTFHSFGTDVPVPTEGRDRILTDPQIQTPVSTNYEDEPPLLEELGINFDHIYAKTMSVLIPTKTIPDSIIDDADLSGPIVFCFILGVCLLMSAKIHFGYIFGFGMFGCAAMYAVLNLMSQNSSIDFMRVCSIVGYCLLPMIPLSILAVFGLSNIYGLIGGLLIVGWATWSCARFFEFVLKMKEQRYLIAYPVFLFYACFALMVIF
eukprot:TRINITY_DN778223_c0_g1_i1.p1 TRINITY_DN778223_c0_g1~~TRINITY_DN778223_c0_g1_i1.p1  ORF type:complete len:238 (+),score=45.53 TRINITY_DN778223_c0_g1_i1:65-715(+)